MGVLDRVRVRLAELRRQDHEGAPDRPGRPRVAALPDPSRPPARRGSWEEAALTNVEVTEVVKRQIRTVTRPWNK
ncbi:MAG: hypothetical protein ABR541_06660 [Candidatus Dormibacteria bacterium]